MCSLILKADFMGAKAWEDSCYDYGIDSAGQ